MSQLVEFQQFKRKKISGPKISVLYHGREDVVYGQIYTEWQKFYTAAGSDKYHLWNGQAKLHSFRPNLPVLTSTSRFYKLLPSVINTAEYCPVLSYPPGSNS